LDWKVRDSAKVEAEILRVTTPGSIVLMHDIHKTTVDAVPAVIKGLSEKGLQFVTVSALVALDKGGESGGAPAVPAVKPASKPAVKSASESKPKAASNGKIPKAVEVKPKAK
jgi:hypothetical protein